MPRMSTALFHVHRCEGNARPVRRACIGSRTLTYHPGREEPSMAKIEKYGAAGVYEPPGYSQGIRVTGAQSILFTAGQVPYDANGGVKHRGDFTAQARAVFAGIHAPLEAGARTLAA